MMSAEMLAMTMFYAGKAAVLGDFARASPFIERFGGFCEYMQSYCPEIQIHPCALASSNSEAMAQRLVELTNLIPDISGVFCTGYTSTIGALEALNYIENKQIRIVGYDVTSRTAEALRNNQINALIFQDPYQQGYQAARLLARHLLEGFMPPKPYLFIENRIVIKSNLDNYVKLKVES
jgi:ABC-type sugar transport system substrate-binding protein